MRVARACGLLRATLQAYIAQRPDWRLWNVSLAVVNADRAEATLLPSGVLFLLGKITQATTPIQLAWDSIRPWLAALLRATSIISEHGKQALPLLTG